MKLARTLGPGLAVAVLLLPSSARGQVERQPQLVSVAVGQSRLVEQPVPMRRVSIADGEIADAVVVSPQEILVNGKQIGTTSLLVWGADGSRRFYTVEVTIAGETLERHIGTLFPGEEIEVTATGNTIILGGSASDARIARRAVAIAEATGATVIDNVEVPAPKQILLQVRFAEVSRNVVEDLAANFIRVDPFDLRGDDEGAIGTGRGTPFSGAFLSDVGPDQTFSDAVNFYVFNPDAQLGVFIQALKTRGIFRSLAEPNLLALDGEEASFLAGGEFPFPVVQGGGQVQAVSIQFREFGIRLNFTPTITNSGNIKLRVAPEVSQLDFARGLVVSGFQVPTILSRKAETQVELRDGQTFAIAGLIDNSMTENIDKIPILGDIPILGALFSSKSMRQDRSELLVLVTPRLVQPSAGPVPVPTGEPETWEWDGFLEEPVGQQGETGAEGR